MREQPKWYYHSNLGVAITRDEV